MSRKYAFNLGRVFTLSLAELFAVFQSMSLNFRVVDLYREILIIETESEIDAEKLQKRLGGTIKIMAALDSLGRKKDQWPSDVFKDYFDLKILKDVFFPASTKGRTVFGISVYPMARQLPLRGEAKRLGLGIKRILEVVGIPSRVVFPQKEALSLPSVVVTNERLFERGAEIDFLVGFDRVWVAKTLTVQDFEGYGRRDYQRPSRDTRIGMLPPKVAQIMINLALVSKTHLASTDHVILDPFVGSGTIIQEAMLIGYKAVGSDIYETAIKGAELNLNWVKNRYQIPPSRFELITASVQNILDEIKDKELEVEAVVTEGTLGPAYTEPPTDDEVKKNFKDLEKIYLGAFENFKKILKPGKRVVVALPAYRMEKGYRFMPIVDKIAKIGYDILDPLPSVLTEKFDFLEITDRKSIIYDRKDQFVSREIFIFSVN